MDGVFGAPVIRIPFVGDGTTLPFQPNSDLLYRLMPGQALHTDLFLNVLHRTSTDQLESLLNQLPQNEETQAQRTLLQNRIDQRAIFDAQVVVLLNQADTVVLELLLSRIRDVHVRTVLEGILARRPNRADAQTVLNNPRHNIEVPDNLNDRLLFAQDIQRAPQMIIPGHPDMRVPSGGRAGVVVENNLRAATETNETTESSEEEVQNELIEVNLFQGAVVVGEAYTDDNDSESQSDDDRSYDYEYGPNEQPQDNWWNRPLDTDSGPDSGKSKKNPIRRAIGWAGKQLKKLKR